MRRQKRIFLNLSCLTAIALLLPLWAGSYSTQDAVMRRSVDGGGSLRTTTLYSGFGLFMIQRESEAYANPLASAAMTQHARAIDCWDWRSGPAAFIVRGRFGARSDVDLWDCKVAHYSGSTNSTGISVPYWALACATMLPVALCVPAWVRARVQQWAGRRRHSRGLCPSCGYDLRATSNRCPECGVAAQAKAG